MKRIIVFFVALSLITCLCSCSEKSEEPDNNYLEKSFTSVQSSSDILNIDIVFGEVSRVNEKLICVGYVYVFPKKAGYFFEDVKIDYKVSLKTFYVPSNNSWSPSSAEFTLSGFTGKILLDSNGYGYSSILFVNDGGGTHPLDSHDWTCKITKISGSYLLEK